MNNRVCECKRERERERDMRTLRQMDNRRMDREGQRDDGQRYGQMDRQKDGRTVQTVMVNYLSATKRLLTSLPGEGLQLYY